MFRCSLFRRSPVIGVLTALMVLAGVVVAIEPAPVDAAPADGPWATEQRALGANQVNFLGQSDQVFGFRFQPLRNGRVTSLSGRFSGAKTVVLADVSRNVLATRTVTGNVFGWSGTSLGAGIPVQANRSYIVAVKVARNWSSSLVWGVNMPFTRGDVQVLNAVAGRSGSSNPATWIRSIQPNTQPMLRGMVDIEFTPNPVSGDPYPQTPGVIDSFGQVAPQGPLGPGWGAVDAYYANFPRRPGECSKEVHSRYWVRGADGRVHPTWHPPVDASGCAFGHEHGDDPRQSDLYRFSEGIGFAMTKSANATGNRVEDHVGHKITVQDDWRVVNGSPQNGSASAGTTEVITRSNITCDWLSKVHQGSHSNDALRNNGHEYFLNVSCSDDLKLRLKGLLTWGAANYAGGTPAEFQAERNRLGNAVFDAEFPQRAGQSVVTNVCGTNATELFNPGFTPNQPIAQGNNPSGALRDLDGKREFACVSDLLTRGADFQRFEELWKPDGMVRFPTGGWIDFSPYYVVFNPARYVDDEWAERGRANAFFSTANLCVNDNPWFRNSRPTPGFCSQVPQSVRDASPANRISHPDNPMNGTKRVIHPKVIAMDTTSLTARPDGTIHFCSNARITGIRIIQPGQNCGPGEVSQMVSQIRRPYQNQSGSDVGATTDPQGNLRGAGYLNEWVRDFDHPTIRFPN